jgi:hypothetical protein
MVTLIPTTMTGPGTLVSLDYSDSLIIDDGVVLTSTDGVAVSGWVFGQSVIIRGSVLSYQYAVLLSPDAGSTPGNSVTVEEGASVVSSTVGGLLCHGYGTSVVNHGLIEGFRYGLSLKADGSETHSTILNTGTIRGGNLAVFRDASVSTERIVLKNSGLIESEGMSYGYFAGNHTGEDQITNTGRMIGAIELQGGADVYRGRAGFVDGTINGGDGDDRLSGGREDNVLDGDAGSDIISGGLGADSLTGGAGPDTFLFRGIAESRQGAGRHDSIGDFLRAEGDVIDLGRIDADSIEHDDQAFQFIGSAAFSQETGQLRYQSKGTDTLVLADIDGDGKADFKIRLEGTLALEKGDFIL